MSDLNSQLLAVPAQTVVLFKVPHRDSGTITNHLLALGISSLYIDDLPNLANQSREINVCLIIHSALLGIDEQQQLNAYATDRSTLVCALGKDLSSSANQDDVVQMLQARHIRFARVPMHNFDNDFDLMKITAESIDMEAPTLLAELKTMHAEGNVPACRRLVHTLKGHVRLFGETNLSELMQKLEDLLAGGQALSNDELLVINQNMMNFTRRMALMAKTQ